MGAKFTLRFDMDSAAFTDEEGDYATEAARIIHNVARQVAEYKNGGRISDVNGNKIGSWKLR
jgi:hypothetical protein